MAVDRQNPFLGRLRESQLLEEAQLKELAGLSEAQEAEPTALARAVLKRGWLTKYQLNQVAQGKINDLRVGPYVLLDRLGEGGMGQVFKAHHQHMERTVALKVIRKEKLGSSDAVKRFYQEIKAAAQLTHPNIVMAYDAGPAGNGHYFAMEYIEGVDLSQLVKESGPLPVLLASEYIRQAALGLQHAHERGLVHRDIKPANLLLGKPGKEGQKAGVKILDMGLARFNGGGGEREKGLTQTGQVIGTPDFLAPEQAMDSHSADIRADIYSLGCSLYYLLSGKAPFQGETLTKVLLQHQMDEVPPISNRDDVPEGLEEVIATMMAKRVEDRYQTPAEVADALEPYSRGEAGAESAFAAIGEKATKRKPREDTLSGDEGPARFAGRKNSTSTTAMLPGPKKKKGAAIPADKKKMILLAAVGGGVFLLALVVLLIVLLTRPGSPQIATGPGPGSNLPKDKDKDKDNQGKDKDKLKDKDREKDNQVKDKDKLKDKDKDKNKDNVVIKPPDDPIIKPMDPVVLAPGEVKLLADADPKKRMPVSAVAFSPNGRLGVSAGYEWAIVWNLETGQEIRRIKGQHQETFWDAAFSPDSARVMLGSTKNVAQLIDVATGEVVQRFKCPQDVWSVALSTNGRFAATGSGKIWATEGKMFIEDCVVRLWDVSTGQELFCTAGFKEPIKRVRFTTDGTKLLFGTGKFYGVVDVEARKETVKSWSPGPVNAFDFAPDGRFALVGGGNGSLHVYDLQADKVGKRLEGHKAWVTAVAIAADGKRAVSGSGEMPIKDGKQTPFDCTVRLWDLDSGKELGCYEGHTDIVRSVAVTKAGLVLSAGGDKTTRLLDLNAKPVGPGPVVAPPPAVLAPGELKQLAVNDPRISLDPSAVAISPDGRRGVSAGYQWSIVWDLAAGQEIRRIQGQGQEKFLDAAFSSDGNRVLLGSSIGAAQLIDVLTGEVVRRFTSPKEIWSVALSPDGRYAATGTGSRWSADGKTMWSECSIRVWEISSGKEVFHSQEYHDPITRVRFTADSKRLMYANGQSYGVVDVEGKREKVKNWTDVSAKAVGFAPDGRFAVVGGDNGSLQIYDLESDKAGKQLVGHTGAVQSIAVAADGKRVVSGSGAVKKEGDNFVPFDLTVRLWDLDSGKEQWRFEGHTNQVVAVAVTGDGSRILSASKDNTTRLLEPTARAVAAVPGAGEIRKYVDPQKKPAHCVACANESSLAVSGYTGYAVFWNTDSGIQLKRITGQPDEVFSAAAFSHDGKSVLLGTSRKSARLYNANTVEEIKRFDCGAPVDGVALSNDGRYAATSIGSITIVEGKVVAQDGLVRVWEIASGQEVYASPALPSPVQGLCFANDNKRLLYADQQAGHILEIASKQEQVVPWNLAGVGAVGFEADGRRAIVAVEGNALQVVELKNGELGAKLTGHTARVNRIRCAPQNAWALSAAGEIRNEGGKDVPVDCSVRVWNLDTGEELGRFTGPAGPVTCLAFPTHLEPKRTFVIGCQDAASRSVDVFRLPPTNAAEIRRVIDPNRDWVDAVSFSPDGRLAVYNSRGSALVWDAASGREVRRFQPPANRTTRFFSAVFSRDGTKLLCSVGKDQQGSMDAAYLYEIASGKELKRFDCSSEIRCLALSPDGRYAVTANAPGSKQGASRWGYYKAVVRLWEIASGKEVFHSEELPGDVKAVLFTADGKKLLYADDRTCHIRDLEGERESTVAWGELKNIRSICFAPDGQRALLGEWDPGTIHLFDLQSGKVIRQLTGSLGGVGSISISQDGKRALTASGGGRKGDHEFRNHVVRFWNLETGDELGEFGVHFEYVVATAISPDGAQGLTGSWDTTARQLDLSKLRPPAKP
jgi:WD40 repeat protein/serine/threonine protein kinase